MTEEVKKYAEKRILESNIRMVPGHYPEFDNKEQVDRFMEMSAKMSELACRSREEFRANIFDLTDVDLNEYQFLLERLKRNKENVSLELLTTKYRKSYDQLKEKLRSMTKDIFQDIVLSGLQIEQTQAKEKYMEINAAIVESGLLEKVSHAVFHQQDMGQVLEYAGQLREIVQRIVKGREKDG
ncbi:MAG TPA: hypothetical protein DDW53_20300 [Lachnoclostridium sp.]|nr:hypothetical protein [Lachnoclostridium sp.]